MADYLAANELQLSVFDRQFLFQCRTNDTNVRMNRTWKYENTHCTACKDTNEPETQEHTLLCETLTNKNYNITYIPTYNDLFSSNVSDQIYVSRIIQENIEIRDHLNVRPAHVN